MMKPKKKYDDIMLAKQCDMNDFLLNRISETEHELVANARSDYGK